MALPSKETTQSLLRDYGGTILVAVLAALLIRFFVVEAYRIPNSAMRPALEAGDTIFVAKWPYLFKARKPARGEIVVFTLGDDSRRNYIKRVVGLEGDTVEVRNGHLLVSGRPTEVPSSMRANCAEERTQEGAHYPVCFEKPTIEDFGPQKVPHGSVFLLGDLRIRTPNDPNTDLPVKNWGIQPVSSIKGSALWIWLSVEPQSSGVTNGLFPSLRFDRMFRRIQ